MEDIGANLAMLEEKIWQIGEPTDVIVLPEMFTTGFTMKAGKLAEMMNMRTFKWMKQMADQTGALILEALSPTFHDRYYNRCSGWNQVAILKHTTNAIFSEWRMKTRYIHRAKVY